MKHYRLFGTILIIIILAVLVYFTEGPGSGKSAGGSPQKNDEQYKF